MMDNNQLKCSMCGAQFNSQQELDAHSQQAHGKTEENKEEHAITCSMCGVRENSQDDLQKHVGEAHKM